MRQTRVESLIETTINTMMGFGISYAVGPIYFAYLGLEHNHLDNLVITAGFTALSIVRGYIVRRFFNAGIHQTAHKLAKRITNGN